MRGGETMKTKDVSLFLEKNTLTSREAREFLGMSPQAFNQSVSTGRIEPFFERGEGTRKIRLFLVENVISYKITVARNRRS